MQGPFLSVGTIYTYLLRMPLVFFGKVEVTPLFTETWPIRISTPQTTAQRSDCASAAPIRRCGRSAQGQAPASCGTPCSPRPAMERLGAYFQVIRCSLRCKVSIHIHRTQFVYPSFSITIHHFPSFSIIVFQSSG